MTFRSVRAVVALGLLAVTVSCHAEAQPLLTGDGSSAAAARGCGRLDDANGVRYRVVVVRGEVRCGRARRVFRENEAVSSRAGAPTTWTRSPHTVQFALNVFHKNYTYPYSDPAKTTILDGSWRGRCRRLTDAAVPTARCRLAWSSEHAEWIARGRFVGAVRIAPRPPYRRFRWRFRVTERCSGDVCDLMKKRDRVKRHLWRGTGMNTPA
jgi:hypothetical protein